MLKAQSILEQFDLVKELDDKSAALYSGGKLVCEFEESQLDEVTRLLDEARTQVEVGSDIELSILLTKAISMLAQLQSNYCREKPDIF